MDAISREELEIADEIVANANLSSADIDVLKRVVAGYRKAIEKLNCVEHTIEEHIPALSEAFRRFGCGSTWCRTPECPEPWPCQASGIYKAVEGLKKCIEG